MSNRKFFLNKEQLLVYCNQGLSREEIAKQLNISTASVSNYMRKFEIDHTYDLSRIHISKEQIESFLKNKTSRNQAAIQLGCNISTVQKFCDKYQLHFPRKEIDKDKHMRRSALNSYRVGAKSRGLEFSLSEEYFYELVVKPCVYCGDVECNVKQRTHYTRSIKLPFKYTGIDRVDSSKGYTVENSVSCCNICNRAKREMLADDFKKWISRLVKFNQ